MVKLFVDVFLRTENSHAKTCGIAVEANTFDEALVEIGKQLEKYGRELQSK